ncbi:MAG: glutamate--tRNA ligase [Bacteriovoracaceae bacterium]
MSVRVRFAPSPTGYLHIGGARTALYSYLFAKANNGTNILRVEDTDLERSKREYEESQIEDLAWLGIDYDESPEKPGKHGPYRQSERTEIYTRYASEFVEKGVAYPCFLTEDDLEELTEKAKSEEKPHHFYHGRYRDLSKDEAQKRIDAGEEYVIRFKNPKKKYTFTDLVRGEVTFPEDMVGDFVIIRSNKMPVYNFCCVIDDHLMEISHVIRAEDHLNNTLRQLMIYEALDAKTPEFAHVSLLVGEDRQKLSKRHGATSVSQYQDDGFLPEALNNYLCLLGWSHPDEVDIFTLEEASKVFNLERFSKSSSLYDIKKLIHFNGEHIKKMELQVLNEKVSELLKSNELFQGQSDDWKSLFISFFQDKVEFIKNYDDKLSDLFRKEIVKSEEFSELISLESTTQIINFASKLLFDEIQDQPFLEEEQFSNLMSEIKKSGIKGKPLFKGLRVVMTLNSEGPDLKTLMKLTPVEILKARVKTLKEL